MARPVVLAPLLAVALAACGGGDTVEGPPPEAPDEIAVTSAAFEEGAEIPREFTCEPHRYVFTLYALDSDPGLEAGASPAEVREAVADAAVARGQLTGRFGR